ncbi:MAG: hypothetical protein ACL93V_07740 [Candidatus Electrothrix sp. YB6]
MPAPFTPEQLEDLSLNIDEQLDELRNSPSPYSGTKASKESKELPDRTPKQWQAIAEVTEEEPQTFWQRFKLAAHKDLCEEGGVLHDQWQKWGDLRKESVLKSFGAILVAMGFSGNALQVLAVAVAVIVMHIGCTAICAED